MFTINIPYCACFNTSHICPRGRCMQALRWAPICGQYYLYIHACTIYFVAHLYSYLITVYDYRINIPCYLYSLLCSALLYLTSIYGYLSKSICRALISHIYLIQYLYPAFTLNTHNHYISCGYLPTLVYMIVTILVFIL